MVKYLHYITWCFKRALLDFLQLINPITDRQAHALTTVSYNTRCCPEYWEQFGVLGPSTLGRVDKKGAGRNHQLCDQWTT